MNHVLEEIAFTYGLNETELKNKWGSMRSCVSPPQVFTDSPTPAPPPSECNGGECCAPEPVAAKPKKSTATRTSRKKKQKEDVIETEEYEWDGVKYLVDNQNNVYTYNIEEPALVGEKLVDGTVKLFT
jgi:hypothetical protein